MCFTAGWQVIVGFKLSKGIPQGSILGPVLFTIHTNNIMYSIVNCNAHLYTDSTVLSSFANNAQSTIEILQAFDKLKDEL